MTVLPVSAAARRQRIAVCIPVFNPQERFLAPLFDSLRAQDVDLELVAIDDASDVDARQLLADCSSGLDVVIERNDRNLGMVGNWNAVVRRSSAELAMVLCQDDVLDAEMLAAYAQEFIDDPSVVICGGAEQFIDEHGNRIDRVDAVTQRSRIFTGRERYELTADELTRLSLRNGQAFGEPSAVMFRRRIFDQLGGYRDQFEHAPDIDFNLRCTHLGIAAYVNHPYLRRRIHSENLTWNHIASGASSRDRVRLHEEYASSVDDTTRARARVTLVTFALNDARRALAAKRWGVARLNLRIAWRFKLNSPRRYVEHLWELWSHKNLDER